MLVFDKRYFLLTVVLFVTEVLIALYVRDAIIRPYGGDFLVVILMYCAVRTFIKAPVWKVALGVLLFSYFIEAMQYLHIVDRLGLRGNRIARTVIGTGFEWKDLAAYTLGILTVLFFERANLRSKAAGIS